MNPKTKLFDTLFFAFKKNIYITNKFWHFGTIRKKNKKSKEKYQSQRWNNLEDGTICFGRTVANCTCTLISQKYKDVFVFQISCFWRKVLFGWKRCLLIKNEFSQKVCFFWGRWVTFSDVLSRGEGGQIFENLEWRHLVIPPYQKQRKTSNTLGHLPVGFRI